MGDNFLVGCSYNELNAHTPVFNISTLGKSILIKIPQPYCKYQLYEMFDISGKAPREVDFFGKAISDFDHPWIEIETSVFNLRSGKHIYRLNFINQSTNTSFSTFISYIAQDDNPETPYIYMKNRGNTDPSENAWKDGKYADTFFENLSKEVEETYGYDPLLFGESLEANYCSLCALPSCKNCPYKEE